MVFFPESPLPSLAASRSILQEFSTPYPRDSDPQNLRLLSFGGSEKSCPLPFHRSMVRPPQGTQLSMTMKPERGSFFIRPGILFPERTGSDSPFRSSIPFCFRAGHHRLKKTSDFGEPPERPAFTKPWETPLPPEFRKDAIREEGGFQPPENPSQSGS